MPVEIRQRLLARLTKVSAEGHMHESRLGPWLVTAARFERLVRWSLNKSFRLEGGHIHSVTARRIMQKRFGIVIGDYSHGPCFDPSAFGAGTTIGRYVSIAQGVRAYQANHPMDRLSMHGFFFNSALGYIPATNVPLTILTIEHDAWIGDAAIITPRCQRIGLGAVIGAGSVVTKDVPDFAVVAGNPARLIRWRFAPEIQECIRHSRWWELPIGEIARYIPSMSASLGKDPSSHPLLRSRAATDTGSQ
jgi:virginiamycin A acetyltransferase